MCGERCHGLADPVGVCRGEQVAAALPHVVQQREGFLTRVALQRRVWDVTPLAVSIVWYVDGKARKPSGAKAIRLAPVRGKVVKAKVLVWNRTWVVAGVTRSVRVK